MLIHPIKIKEKSQVIFRPAYRSGNGDIVPNQVLTANNKSSVTKAFGIAALKEETSVNFSGGFTARPHPKFSITADAYFITIDHRIVLTSRFTDGNPAFASILAPFKDAGVSQAQFFSNAVDTETKGVDIVAAFFTPLGEGKLDVNLAANFTDTEVRLLTCRVDWRLWLARART